MAPEATQYIVGAYRIDFVLSIAAKLGLECDRIAALEAAGWRLMHVTWDDVTVRPFETISRLRRALLERTIAAAPQILAVRGRA